MIGLATWSVPAASQVADLLNQILAAPGPALGPRDAGEFLLDQPDHTRLPRRTLTWEYRRLEPFTDGSTSGNALWSRSSSLVRYAQPLRLGGWRLGVASAVRRDRLHAWIEDEPDRPGLSGDAVGGELEAWATDDRFLHARVRGPVGGGRSTSPHRAWDWALLWTPTRRDGLVVERRGATLQSRFLASVGDDRVDFRLNQDLALLRLEGRHELVPGLSVSVARLIGDGSPDLPLTTAFRDEMQLNGEFDSVVVSANARLYSRFEVGVRRADWTMKHEGGLYWGGQRYGRLNVLRGYGDDRGGAILWRPAGRWTARLDGVWRAMDASGRGRVESWPFTETAVDLLGLRRVAEGALELTMRSLALRLGRESGASRLEAGYVLHSVRLDGFQESWIPGPLGIGRSDYQLRGISVEKIRISEVRLRWSRSLGGMGWSLDVRQIVAASAESRSRGSETDPGGGEPGSRPVPTGWWGGLTLRSAVRIPF